MCLCTLNKTNLVIKDKEIFDLDNYKLTNCIDIIEYKYLKTNVDPQMTFGFLRGLVTV